MLGRGGGGREVIKRSLVYRLTSNPKQEKTHQTTQKVLTTTDVCNCISISLTGGTEKTYLKNRLCHPFWIIWILFSLFRLLEDIWNRFGSIEACTSAGHQGVCSVKLIERFIHTSITLYLFYVKITLKCPSSVFKPFMQAPSFQLVLFGTSIKS